MKDSIELIGKVLKIGDIENIRFYLSSEKHYFNAKAEVKEIDDNGTIHFKGIGEMKIIDENEE